MLIKIKVFPNSKKESVIKKSSDSFEIKTKAKAERGEANQAVKKIMAKELGISPDQLRFIKGGRSHNKIAEIIC